MSSALGETGLDYTGDVSRSEQITSFEMQIDLAAQLDLPLLLHFRSEVMINYYYFNDWQMILAKNKALKH